MYSVRSESPSTSTMVRSFRMSEYLPSLVMFMSHISYIRMHY